MEQPFPAAGALDRLHDLRAALPQTVHLRDKLRRVLKIAVNADCAVSGGVFQSREYRAFLAEIPGESQSAHVRVSL